MARRLRLGSSLLTQLFLLVATIIECEFALTGFSVGLVGAAMFVNACPAKAQHYDPWFNAGDLSFELERYWPHEPSHVSLADYQTDSRVALRNRPLT